MKKKKKPIAKKPVRKKKAPAKKSPTKKTVAAKKSARKKAPAKAPRKKAAKKPAARKKSAPSKKPARKKRLPMKVLNGEQINKDNAKEYGRRGGIASGISRARKKILKDIAETIIDPNCQAAVDAEYLKEYLGIPPEDDIDIVTLAGLKQLEKAVLTGDTFAYLAVMDRLYGKPSPAGPPKTEVAPPIAGLRLRPLPKNADFEDAIIDKEDAE